MQFSSQGRPYIYRIYRGVTGYNFQKNEQTVFLSLKIYIHVQ